MEQEPTFIEFAVALLAGPLAIVFLRLMGTAFDYRGIVWRRPNGYLSSGPLKDALIHDKRFNYYYDRERFAAGGRIFLYVMEAGCLLFTASILFQFVGWGFSRLVGLL